MSDRAPFLYLASSALKQESAQALAKVAESAKRRTKIKKMKGWK